MEGVPNEHNPGGREAEEAYWKSQGLEGKALAAKMAKYDRGDFAMSEEETGESDDSEEVTN